MYFLTNPMHPASPFNPLYWDDKNSKNQNKKYIEYKKSIIEQKPICETCDLIISIIGVIITVVMIVCIINVLWKDVTGR